MATVSLDKEKCIGCGLCTSICPEVFELKEDGKAYVKGECGEGCDCSSAAESCPVQAITYKK